MLSAPMAATKTRKPRSTKAPEPKPERADGRRKSKLALAAERAAIEAKRALLLETLASVNWNLAAAARELELVGTPSVIRELLAVAPAEYEAAKTDGRIAPGKRNQTPVPRLTPAPSVVA